MRLFLLALFFLSVFLACESSQSIDNSQNPLTSSEIEAKSRIYLNNLATTFPRSSSLNSIKKTFWKKYLLPWQIKKAELNQYLKDSSIPGKDIFYTQNNFANPDNEWFSENKQAYSEKIKKRIAANIDLTTFPNFFRPGITINHTSIRRIPSDKPGYDTYSKAGEGFPFDYFQETGVWANTPVLLLHLSKDRQWVYTLTAFYKGWVRFSDLAIVDKSFMNKWNSGTFSFLIKDHTPISSRDQLHGLDGRIGMIFPSGANPQTVKMPIAAANRKAVLVEATINPDHISQGFATMNEMILKSMANDMLGQAYGWGGYLENRDCSSTIRDYLTPFGIWLPRNSTDQAKYGEIVDGQYYDLSDIQSREQKLALIKEKGIPFLSILWKKGHSLLYIGQTEEGMPLVMHTIWGLKTLYENTELLSEVTSRFPIEGIHQVSIEDANGQKQTKFIGRRLIGKTVITPLDFDQVYPDLQSFLVDDLVKMSVLVSD
jgi:hypothetical protein